MRKLIFLTISIFVFAFALPTSSFAQGQQQEELMGKKLLDDLSNKTVTCSQLKDADFEKIGEYFMGKMIGSSHEAMNTMMVRMMGKEGEEQMHIAMGKRMSNCEPDALMPQNMPALSGVEGMNMMMGNFGTNPMSWLGWGFGWVFMLLFWILIIAGIVALIKWIINQPKDERKDKLPLDILKERYAKGEIDKKEFEERKKDLI